MSAKNARFWTWVHDGFVKVTVKPAQVLRHFEYSRDEEGYSLQTNDYEISGDVVVNRWHWEGRDCDGKTSRDGTSACAFDRLKANSIPEWADGPENFHNGARIMTPDWQEVRKTRQRDYAAEAAGY